MKAVTLGSLQLKRVFLVYLRKQSVPCHCIWCASACLPVAFVCSNQIWVGLSKVLSSSKFHENWQLSTGKKDTNYFLIWKKGVINWSVTYSVGYQSADYNRVLSQFTSQAPNQSYAHAQKGILKEVGLVRLSDTEGSWASVRECCTKIHGKPDFTDSNHHGNTVECF